MPNSPIKILVVDDEPLLLWALERAFNDRHLEVRTSSSTQQALKEIEAECFDLFLLDFNLRDSARAEVLKAIDGRCPYVPIIIMTTSDTTSCELNDAIRDIRKHGEWHLLEKPFSLDKLIAFVEMVFREPGDARVCLNSLTHNYDHEKRGHLRRPHVQPVHFFFKTTIDGVSQRIDSKGILTDISNSGSCMLVHEQLQPEQLISFDDVGLKQTARVSWCTMIEESTYRCGIQFCGAGKPDGHSLT